MTTPKNDSLPNIIDIKVGEKVRTTRIMIGMSQEELGKKNGVSFQQIQKYEKGQNRITVRRLFAIANSFNISVSDFFLNLNKNGTTSYSMNEQQEDYNISDIDSKEVFTLVKCFTSIADSSVRKKILSLVKSLNKAS